ncbi:hypothetical protein XI00_06525 [Bradyrhizobium sp. CCBAU 21359]|nr:hypothetical protein [Bradyrhizobium sp. CCBAU 21359]
MMAYRYVTQRVWDGRTIILIGAHEVRPHGASARPQSTSVLLLQGAQTLCCGKVLPDFCLLIVVRRFGNIVLASQVSRLGPSAMLVQYRDDPLFHMYRLAIF